MAGREVAVGEWVVPRKDYMDPFRKNRKRKPPEMKKSFQIAEMHEMHHEIARRIVIGQKPKEIAKDLNCNYHTVICVKNSPIVQEQINILSGARDKEVMDVATQIREMAPKAIRVLDNILDDDEESSGLKMKTALAVLDRAGHSVPKNVNVKGVHAILRKEDIEAIQQRAVEIGLESGVIDVESRESISAG